MISQTHFLPIVPWQSAFLRFDKAWMIPVIHAIGPNGTKVAINALIGPMGNRASQIDASITFVSSNEYCKRFMDEPSIDKMQRIAYIQLSMLMNFNVFIFHHPLYMKTAGFFRNRLHEQGQKDSNLIEPKNRDKWRPKKRVFAGVFEHLRQMETNRNKG